MNGQNYILAQTPLQFIPLDEFEKRQKSIKNSNSWIPIESYPQKTTAKRASKPKAHKKKSKKK